MIVSIQTFVAQSQEDCDTLNHHINDSGALGRKARITTWFRARQDDMLIPPPMSREGVCLVLTRFHGILELITMFQLAELHFDGYALDYIDYPEGLQWFLKRELNLHRTVCPLLLPWIEMTSSIRPLPSTPMR